MFMVVAIEDKKEPLRQRLGRLLRGGCPGVGGPQLRWEPLPIYSVARPSRTAALEPAGPAVSPPAFSGAAAAGGIGTGGLPTAGLPAARLYGKADGGSRPAGHGTNRGKGQRIAGAAGPAGNSTMGLRGVAGLLPGSKGIYLAAKPLCCRGNHAAGGIRPAAAMGGDPSRAGGLFHLRGALSNRSDTGAAADNHCRPQWDTGEPHSEPADAGTDAGTAGGGATGGGTNRLLGDGNGVRYPPGEAAADPWGMPH